MSRIHWLSGLTCAALLASGPALAAERRWEVMETPHFSVHYYPETKESAQSVATAAEEVLPKLLKDFGIELQNRVPIILSREVMFNGNAEPIKDRITLDPLLAKSSVIGTKRFIAHELTHVITFQALASNVLFSKLTKLSSLSNLPTWFLEGLAQYEAEAWSPNNDRMLRLGTLEGKLLTEGQRNHFAMLGLYGGAAGYNEGYSLTKYLFDTYGHDKLNQLFTALRTDATLTFPMALEKVTGKKLGVIQQEWQKSIKQRYETLAKNTPALPEGAISLVPSKDGTANVAPRLSPDGKQLAYLTSDGQESFLYLRGHIMGLLS
ncbi:MAG: peptidase MA family metallohydrolase, partial [Bacteroidota bacterium]